MFENEDDIEKLLEDSRKNDYIKRDLEYISKIGAEYVLFHYPKPVLLDRSVDWSNWKLAAYINALVHCGMRIEQMHE